MATAVIPFIYSFTTILSGNYQVFEFKLAEFVWIRLLHQTSFSLLFINSIKLFLSVDVLISSSFLMDSFLLSKLILYTRFQGIPDLVCLFLPELCLLMLLSRFEVDPTKYLSTTGLKRINT